MVRIFFRMGPALAAILLMISAMVAQELDAAMSPRPNILWLTAEDIGPHVGCYGDTVAHTPNLDSLAKRGIIYHVA